MAHTGHLPSSTFPFVAPTPLRRRSTFCWLIMMMMIKMMMMTGTTTLMTYSTEEEKKILLQIRSYPGFFKMSRFNFSLLFIVTLLVIIIVAYIF